MKSRLAGALALVACVALVHTSLGGDLKSGLTKKSAGPFGG